MNKLYLGLALHNHQPIGNFDSCFQDAYEQAYLPMLEALERHPHVRLSLHYSGPLIDWLQDHAPQFLERLTALVKRGQVEMMTGGYYEPILPMVPDADKVGQIGKLSERLRELFGRQPSGLWLTERVWEPSLPAALASAGVRWTILDDTHFQMIGLSDGELTGSFLTEEQGQTLRLFASSGRLRYAVPWHEVDEVIAYLRGCAGEKGRILVMGDDGEKFGCWPTTYEHCWRKGWVDRFFEALGREQEWLETIPLGEHAERFPAKGLVYIPTASYEEMMEWSLPAAAAAELHNLRDELKSTGRQEVLRHLGAGFWRNFLHKYPESNAMHKRMLRTHDKVRRAGQVGDNGKALDLLWQGQSNCPYWHGVFGGLYLNHIRTANHSRLVAAEREADRILHGREPWSESVVCDFDLDGRGEILVQTQDISVMLCPSLGGAIKEWDLRAREWGLITAIARRPEAYHDRLLKEAPAEEEGGAEELRSIHDDLPPLSPELRESLVYDRRPRLAFLEQVLPASVQFDDFVRETYEPVIDLSAVSLTSSLRTESDGVVVALAGEVRVDTAEGPVELAFEKSLQMPKEGTELRCALKVRHLSGPPLKASLVSEWNVNLPGGDHEIIVDGGKAASLSEPKEEPSARRVLLKSDRLCLPLAAEPAAKLWRFPVQTVSNSDRGLELTTQGHCLAIVWPLTLAPGAEQEMWLAWQEQPAA